MTSWRKSSRSSTGEQGGCVEVAAVEEAVAVRDSTDPEGLRLYFGDAEWPALINGVKDGVFEL